VVQNGYLDSIALDRIKEYQRRFTEFLASSESDLLAGISIQEALDEFLTAGLKRAVERFTPLWA
jgi:F0F1-type ATP synthase alpha subunit